MAAMKREMSWFRISALVMGALVGLCFVMTFHYSTQQRLLDSLREETDGVIHHTESLLRNLLSLSAEKSDGYEAISEQAEQLLGHYRTVATGLAEQGFEPRWLARNETAIRHLGELTEQLLINTSSLQFMASGFQRQYHNLLQREVVLAPELHRFLSGVLALQGPMDFRQDPQELLRLGDTLRSHPPWTAVVEAGVRVTELYRQRRGLREQLLGMSVSHALQREERLLFQRQAEATTKVYISIGLAFLILVLLIAGVLYQRHRVRQLSHREMQRAAAIKMTFLANMSHEIRTPLNAILGFTELLGKTPLDPRQQEYLQNARVSSRALLSLINDILDLSKIEADKLTLESAPVAVEDLLEQICSLFAAQSADKGLELLVWRDPGVPDSFLGDALRLGQILINLTNNAIKFTEYGEVQLQVSYLSEQEQLRFCVSDTGIGIDQQQREMLFQPFTQANSSMTRKFGGTGLGLSISKRLVELMGGQIGVDNNPGQGVTFWFTVPCRGPQPLPPAGGERLDTVCRQEHVVVICAHPSLASLTRNCLLRLGAGVTMLEQFEPLAQMAPPDYLIVDWPRTEQRIHHYRRQLARLALSCPVLAMIPCGEESDSKLLPPGTYPLHKPFTSSRLARRLTQLKAPPPVLPPKPAEAHRYAGKRVLVVEDNRLNRILTLEMLKQARVSAIGVEGGLAAVELLQGDRFDLVLMDIQMPEMDGYEATAAIRRFTPAGDLPIIALSANTQAEQQQRCLRCGMSGFLGKPLERAELMAVLDRFLGNAVSPASAFAAAPAQPATANTAGMGDAALVNMAQLEARVDHDSEIARVLIELFIGEHQHDGAQLETWLEAKQTDEALQLAHTLKGVAGNLAAEPLETAAQVLEQRLRDGGWPTPEQVQRLQTTLQQTITWLQTYLQRPLL